MIRSIGRDQSRFNIKYNFTKGHNRIKAITVHRHTTMPGYVAPEIPRSET